MKELRRNCRVLLKNKRINISAMYLILILSELIICLIPALLQEYFRKTSLILISVAVIVFLFVISRAISLGFKYYFFRTAKGYDTQIENIFCFLISKNFLKFISYSFVKFALSSAVLFVLCIPSIILMLFLSNVNVHSEPLFGLIILFACYIILTFLGILYYARFNRLMFLCDYYFISGVYLNYVHLFSSSLFIMRKYNKGLLKLRLSFAGWFISCFVILPAGYVFSYYQQMMALFAERIMRIKE